MAQVALDQAVCRIERDIARLQCGGSGLRAAFRVEVRAIGDVIGRGGTLCEFRGRIARVDRWEHRRGRTVAAALLIDERVRKPERVTELVNRDGVNINRARVGIRRSRRVGGEPEPVTRFSVELHVVVEDRAGSVKPFRELDVAVAVGIRHAGDRARYVRVSVLVDVVAVRELRVFDQ